MVSPFDCLQERPRVLRLLAARALRMRKVENGISGRYLEENDLILSVTKDARQLCSRHRALQLWAANAFTAPLAAAVISDGNRMTVVLLFSAPISDTICMRRNSSAAELSIAFA